eukprot:SM000073S21439  [mRNA]  locus=s73:305277:306020:+ [translate_table: standard]
MGGGNAQKSATARERNLAKAAKANKGSQLDTNTKAMTIQVRALMSRMPGSPAFVLDIVDCKVCMQTFMCTTSESKCKEHSDSRHPKVDFSQCFPQFNKT